MLKITREKLFYGKFKYSVNYYHGGLKHITRIRPSSHGMPCRNWVGRSGSDSAKFYYAPIRSILRWSESRSEWGIMDSHTKKVEPFIRLINANSGKREFFTRKEACQLSVFTNDKNLVDDIVSLLHNNVTVTEVDQLFEEGTLEFVNPPPAKYRIYFRSSSFYSRIDGETRSSLCDFFNTQSVKPRSGLQKRLSDNRYKYAWIEQNDYFDCDDDALISYFILLFPSMMRKKYNLVQKKN